MAIAIRTNRSSGTWATSISAAAAASFTDAPSWRRSRRISLWRAEIPSARATVSPNVSSGFARIPRWFKSSCTPFMTLALIILLHFSIERTAKLALRCERYLTEDQVWIDSAQSGEPSHRTSRFGRKICSGTLRSAISTALQPGRTRRRRCRSSPAQISRGAAGQTSARR